jgi:hypothetical protein
MASNLLAHSSFELGERGQRYNLDVRCFGTNNLDPEYGVGHSKVD